MKKLGTLDKIILIIGIVWLLMIPTMIVIFLIKGAIPDTLVQCVMGSSSIELIVAAWIKTTKVKKGENNESGDNDAGLCTPDDSGDDS